MGRRKKGIVYPVDNMTAMEIVEQPPPREVDTRVMEIVETVPLSNNVNGLFHFHWNYDSSRHNRSFPAFRFTHWNNPHTCPKGDGM